MSFMKDISSKNHSQNVLHKPDEEHIKQKSQPECPFISPMKNISIKNHNPDVLHKPDEEHFQPKSRLECRS